MGRCATVLALLVATALVPRASLAQGSIAGTVTDSSGAVLPGVTVEVASPALIERLRSAELVLIALRVAAHARRLLEDFQKR